MTRTRTARRPSKPRPLLVVAALLAVLGLLGMHTVIGTPANAQAGTGEHVAHSAHQHGRPAGPDHAAPDHAAETGHLTPGTASSPTGQPCSPCPSCDHDAASTCVVTPARGGGEPPVTLSDTTLAPHQRASWPSAGGPTARTALPPLSLIALSISRT